MSGDLGGQECSAKSLGHVEAMFHLETDELGCANVAIWNSRPRPFTWYKYHSFGGSWLQKYKVLKLGHSLRNTLYILLIPWLLLYVTLTYTCYLHSITKYHVPFPLLRKYQRISPDPRHVYAFRNKSSF